LLTTEILGKQETLFLILEICIDHGLHLDLFEVYLLSIARQTNYC